MVSLRGVHTSATTIYDRLVESINNVYNDVMANGSIDKETHKSEHELFHIDPGVVDGPW